MPHDSEVFPTANWNLGWWDRAKGQVLRRKHRAAVNDRAWRKSLKPITSHPRREKRGQGKPR